MLGKLCCNCKYYYEDMSCGSCDCKKIDKDELTDEEIEKYFINDEPDCPHHEFPLMSFQEWLEHQFYEDFDVSGLSDEEYYELEDRYREYTHQ